MKDLVGTVDVRIFAPADTARDGSVDWQPYIQNAINFILNSQWSSSGPPAELISHPLTDPPVAATLYMPPGVYMIGAPIIISKISGYDSSGNVIRYDPFTIRIIGDSPPVSSYVNLPILSSTYIIANYPVPSPPPDTMTDPPAIIIQGGFGVTIENLCIFGKNFWNSIDGGIYSFTGQEDNENLRLYDLYMQQNQPIGGSPPGPVGVFPFNFNPNFYYDDQYRQYAGICIDPFAADVPTESQYPTPESLLSNRHIYRFQ